MARVVVVVVEEQRGIGAHVAAVNVAHLRAPSGKALDSDVANCCKSSRLSSGLLCCMDYAVELEKEQECGHI